MQIGIVIPDINFIGGAERVALNLYEFLKKNYQVQMISLFSTDSKNIKSSINVKHLGANKPINLYDRIVFRLVFHRKYKTLLNNFQVLIGNNFFRYYALPLFGQYIKQIEIQHLRYKEELITKVNLKKQISIAIRNLVYKKLDKLVVLTERDKEKFNRKGLENVELIPNGLSFYPEHTAKLENKLAIAIGRLSYEKGFDDLIKVWKMVEQDQLGWKLIIYGEGNMREHLENIARSYNVLDSIFFAGNVSNISDKILESSLTIMTSKYECFPMTILESMSCGVPVISFDFESGPREIIQDGLDGFIIEERNLQEMAEKINYLIKNKQTRLLMGKNARKNIMRYSWQEVGKKWITLLDNIV